MIAALFIALLLLAALLAVVKLLRGGMQHPKNLMELLEGLEIVNPASLGHLACDTDDAFLKKSLPQREYRRVRKLRLKAIRSYYFAAFQNASLLLSYADLLLKSDKPELIEFGQRLGPAALQLRLTLIRALTGIFLCYLLPLNIPRWRQITGLYMKVGSHLESFCEAHAPDLRLELAERFPL